MAGGYRPLAKMGISDPRATQPKAQDEKHQIGLPLAQTVSHVGAARKLEFPSHLSDTTGRQSCIGRAAWSAGQLRQLIDHQRALTHNRKE